MIFHALLVFVSVLVAIFAGQQASLSKARAVLFFAFLCIYIFMAIRYDYGNDYMAYLDIFNESADIDIDSLYQYEGRSEIGWVLLCSFFNSIGFFGFVAVLSFFNCVVYYHLISKYCPREYYWLAIFIYLVDVNNMLVQLSALRQSVAVAIFVLAVDFLVQRKLLSFLMMVFTASLFHTTALVCLLLAPLPYLAFRKERFFVFMYIAAYFILYILVDKLAPVVNSAISVLFERYEVYQDATTVGSGVGMLIWSAIFVFLMHYSSFLLPREKLLLKVGAISFLILPFGLIVSMMTRIGMYFQAILIVAIPLIFHSVESKFIRYLFLALYVTITLYGYYLFFHSPVWMNKFGTYQTIFSVY